MKKKSAVHENVLSHFLVNGMQAASLSYIETVPCEYPIGRLLILLNDEGQPAHEKQKLVAFAQDLQKKPGFIWIRDFVGPKAHPIEALTFRKDNNMVSVVFTSRTLDECDAGG